MSPCAASWMKDGGESLLRVGGINYLTRRGGARTCYIVYNVFLMQRRFVHVL